MASQSPASDMHLAYPLPVSYSAMAEKQEVVYQRMLMNEYSVLGKVFLKVESMNSN